MFITMDVLSSKMNTHLIYSSFQLKVDRSLPDKPVKPAPIVPPKKPVPPPGKGLLRPVALQPKRPDKPQVPSPVAK